VVLSTLAMSTDASPVPAAETLRVFADASMQEVVQDLARAWRIRHPEVRFEFSFAGTRELGARIQQGEEADVLIAADTLETAALHRAGHFGAPVVFARNRLALVTRPGWIVPPQALDIASTLRSGLAGAPEAAERPTGIAGAIADPSDVGQARTALESLVRMGARVALADTAGPAGRSAQRALDQMSQDPVLGASFRERVEAHVVSRERDTRAVLERVATAEVDAGIVYATDTRFATRKVGHLQLPDVWNVNGACTASPVLESPAADAFVAFLSSEYSRTILRRHGFGL
jgi:molybdate transport system substrate-binding protein